MNILIIGDWTIDQNWICGIQRSTISSRTGQIHLRGLNENEGATEALCGAGATASVLHRAQNNDSVLIDKIVGVGIWHEADTNYLRNMIYSPQTRHLHPSGQYTRFLSSETEEADDNKKNLELINISEIKGLDANAGTTRVIRIYHYAGSSSVRLLSRIDWESGLPDGKSHWIDKPKVAKLLIKEIKKKENSFDAVVIKCLNKKIISHAIVKALTEDEIFKNIPWYVSTKQWNPDWQKLLKKVKCRMFLIPQAAVDTAKRQAAPDTVKRPLRNDDDDQKNHGTTRWINSKGFGTKEALKILSAHSYMQRKGKSPSHLLLIVTPSGQRILALGPGKIQNQSAAEKTEYIDDLLIVQNERDTFLDPMPVETPFASILFGAIIAFDLNNLKRNTTDNFDSFEYIEKALDFTRTYIESENGRVTSPESWAPQRDEKNLIINDIAKRRGRFDWHVNTSIKDARKSWDEATKGLGLIERDGQLHLELFRAANEVDGYICLGNDKRRALQRLIMELKGFHSGSRGKSCSCMIVAPPGSGKTRLAKMLASSSGYIFLPFNITQMYRREHLVEQQFSF